MKKYHTAVPWFGEVMTTLSEEVSVPAPKVGEKIILSGGRIVEVTKASAPTCVTNGYAGKRYWRMVIEIDLLN